MTDFYRFHDDGQALELHVGWGRNGELVVGITDANNPDLPSLLQVRLPDNEANRMVIHVLSNFPAVPC